MRSKADKPTLISLFTGAMGLDLGFEDAFDIRVALDNSLASVETIKLNRPEIPIIHNSILNVTTNEILKTARLKVGEPTVITGGSPCQPFSTAGKRLSIEEARGNLVFEFLRVVKEAQPEYFVFENVAGLVTAAIKHISFYERIKKKDTDLAREHQLGSAFEVIFAQFKETKYYIDWGVVNAADYGAAQKRRRLIILGSKNDPKISLPVPTHCRPGSPELLSGSRKAWVTLNDVFNALVDEEPEYLPFPSWGKYMVHIPEGGNWHNLPTRLQKNALKGAYDPTGKNNKGGRTGFYRRLSLSKPAPTLLTSPVYKCSVLAHPIQNRPLSIKEYAKIQDFPDNWKFAKTTKAKYRLIGQAVAIPLSRALCQRILKSRESIGRTQFFDIKVTQSENAVLTDITCSSKSILAKSGSTS
jgi:DNA (cytosine-5)-methyltransferase 1